MNILSIEHQEHDAQTTDLLDTEAGKKWLSCAAKSITEDSNCEIAGITQEDLSKKLLFLITKTSIVESGNILSMLIFLGPNRARESILPNFGESKYGLNSAAYDFAYEMLLENRQRTLEAYMIK